MSDSTKLPTQLPPLEQEFSIDVVGTLTNTQYQGDFKCKILNARERGRAGVRLGALNLGLAAFVEKDADNYHFMISWLEQALISAPEWWMKADKGQELYDVNVIEEIYNAVEKFEDEWYFKVWGKYPDRKKSEKTEG